MEPIYPLREDVVQQFCGMPVCVIMQDGTRHVGILSSCNGGKLSLNGETAGLDGNEAIVSKAPAQTAKKKGKKGLKQESVTQQSVQTQAYPYDPSHYEPQRYNPWGAAFAIDLALIAFLFLLI
ncbi:hypothetical protein [Paenibacillus sp. YIM B09110]|uniref:hypothetical protein n=1 Tax=Paenibacillus sp. YIM B09110 TaxID=3126102 RepID=UPI00301BA7A9